MAQQRQDKSGASSAGKKSKYMDLNLILIGNHAVGKTSLMRQYVQKKFDMDMMATTGVSSMTSIYDSEDGTKCRFQIWDTGGQERYKALVSSFFKTADGVVLTFSLADQQSFLDLRDWIDTVRQ